MFFCLLQAFFPRVSRIFPERTFTQCLTKRAAFRYNGENKSKETKVH